MKYVIGGLVILIGAFLVIKTEIMLAWFGRVGFAERYLGTEGGSRLFYKLLGLLVIFLAFLGMTGILGDMIRDFFGPLIGLFNPGANVNS